MGRISNEPDLIDLEGKHLHSTDLAVLFDFGLDDLKWVPKSVMEDWPDEGEFGDVLIKEWWAEREGLI